jgi:hypothetical protein
VTEPTIHELKASLATANDALERAVRALAPKHVGGEMEAYEAAYERLLNAERRLAAAEDRPYAVLCDCPISWDVGAPLPTLLQSDQSADLFFLLPDDERVGHVHFEQLSSSLFGAPNDETFEGHPLHGSGFEPYRAMRVINSPWIAQLERMNSVHHYHDPAAYAAMEHFIFPFHDTTFECVARSFSTSTVDRRLAEAVKDAVDCLY